MSRLRPTRGFTLIELIVAIGLFAIIMTLTTGAYLIMINVNAQAQAMATGIDNLSFALETMTRTIRTGSQYSCGGGSDCPYPGGNSSFSFTDIDSNQTVTYKLAQVGTKGVIEQQIGSQGFVALTDPDVNVTRLTFYVTGTKTYGATGDSYQPYVTIVVAGTVSSGHGKSQFFSIETGAAMRGIDL